MIGNERKQYEAAAKDAARGVQADELLNHPLFKEAAESIQVALFEEFKDTKLNGEGERHELWQRMQLFKLFIGKFEHVVKTGKSAQNTMTLLEKARDKLGRI